MGRSWHRWTSKEIKFLRENCAKLSYRDIAAHLGIPYGAVKGKASDLRLNGIKPKKKPKPKTEPKWFRRQLCETCQNAVPNPAKGRGCSWSIRLEPVDGWTAIPTNIRPARKGDPKVKSYLILDCPQYLADERAKGETA